MSAITRGPWATSRDHENVGGGLNIYAFVNGDPVRVAHTGRVVFGGEEIISEAEAQANGHAIAAVPEMLAALRRIAAIHQINDPADAANEAMTIAKAAISKAEGK